VIRDGDDDNDNNYSFPVFMDSLVAKFLLSVTIRRFET